MLPVRSHDHHAAVWAHHAEYERRLHSLLDALPKDFADDFGQFIHFLVLPGKTPEVFGLWSFLIIGVARTAALRCTFLHLRLYMLAAPTIENEYRRNALDVRDGADNLHWIAAMDTQAVRIVQHNASNLLLPLPRLPPANLG